MAEIETGERLRGQIMHCESHREAGEIIAAIYDRGAEQERERSKALVEDAYCVEEFLRKVLKWEGSAEDELAEATEAAEKLCAALDPQEDSGA